MFWPSHAQVILHPTYWDLNTGRMETFPVDGFIHSDFDHRWAQHGIHHDHRDHHHASEHDEVVMEMNGVRQVTSGRVQRAPRNVLLMIDEPGPPAGHL
jgi:hypothetical protein